MHKQLCTEALFAASKISATVLIETLLLETISKRGSDIHIDPQDEKTCVRIRIDGLLKEWFELPKNVHIECIARFKILCGLRTDEHFLPQDGRFRFTHSDTWADVRVSIAPTFYGENVVLRLLLPLQEHADLKLLGFNDVQRTAVHEALNRSTGLILVTGPTGSGKTTTLYNLLQVLQTKQLSLNTLEDPVEYAIKGVTQVQVNAQTGFSFAAGLRSMLRQDPDVIMVGEMRDIETASLAISAAHTGHLVLSTLHTNSTVATIARLRDMGIPSFAIASTLRLIISQRLIRTLCEHCKEPDIETQAVDGDGNAEKISSSIRYEAIGCEKCDYSGYAGRIGVFEVVPITPKLQVAIHDQATTSVLCDEIRGAGFVALEQNCQDKLFAGITSRTEISFAQYE